MLSTPDEDNWDDIELPAEGLGTLHDHALPYPESTGFSMDTVPNVPNEARGFISMDTFLGTKSRKITDEGPNTTERRSPLVAWSDPHPPLLNIPPSGKRPIAAKDNEHNVPRHVLATLDKQSSTGSILSDDTDTVERRGDFVDIGSISSLETTLKAGKSTASENIRDRTNAIQTAWGSAATPPAPAPNYIKDGKTFKPTEPALIHVEDIDTDFDIPLDTHTLKLSTDNRDVASTANHTPRHLSISSHPDSSSDWGDGPAYHSSFFSPPLSQYEGMPWLSPSPSSAPSVTASDNEDDFDDIEFPVDNLRLVMHEREREASDEGWPEEDGDGDGMEGLEIEGDVKLRLRKSSGERENADEQPEWNADVDLGKHFGEEHRQPVANMQERSDNPLEVDIPSRRPQQGYPSPTQDPQTPPRHISQRTNSLTTSPTSPTARSPSKLPLPTRSPYSTFSSYNLYDTIVERSHRTLTSAASIFSNIHTTGKNMLTRPKQADMWSGEELDGLDVAWSRNPPSERGEGEGPDSHAEIQRESGHSGAAGGLGQKRSLSSAGSLTDVADGQFRPRSSRQNSSPSHTPVNKVRIQRPPRKKPTLIRNLGTSHPAITLGEMHYNPHLQTWEGNESLLSIFETHRPNITHIPHTHQDAKPHMISGSEYICPKSVDGMKFDPIKMCWIGNEEERDVFDGIEDMSVDVRTESFSVAESSVAGRDQNPFSLAPSMTQSLAISESSHKIFMGKWYPRSIIDSRSLRDTSKTHLYEIRNQMKSRPSVKGKSLGIMNERSGLGSRNQGRVGVWR